MTAFINLPAEVQTVFTVLMFIAFVGEICLLFYIISHKSTAGKISDFPSAEISRDGGEWSLMLEWGGENV